MKFKYKKFKIPPTSAFPERKYLLRPILPLLVTYKNKTIGYEALLDSGADFCIFHAEIGEFLDIPILEGKKEYFGGIVGQKAIAYIHLSPWVFLIMLPRMDTVSWDITDSLIFSGLFLI